MNINEFVETRTLVFSCSRFSEVFVDSAKNNFEAVLLGIM